MRGSDWCLAVGGFSAGRYDYEFFSQVLLCSADEIWYNMRRWR